MFCRSFLRQHFFTEFTDASMPPKTMLVWLSTGFRRIMPTYHNWLTLNFTASDSSSDDRYSWKLTQLADSKFQLSITLFEIAYFLTFSLNLFLNSLWSCPLLSPSSSWKNNSGLVSYFQLTILKVSIRSLLILHLLPLSLSHTVYWILEIYPNVKICACCRSCSGSAMLTVCSSNFSLTWVAELVILCAGRFDVNKVIRITDLLCYLNNKRYYLLL